ncbi:MAG: glycoside hydrolase family 97 catalytic domain-containing protein [Bacteroidales bacterium]|nr:glycoside hydrolase family 97 catalytic domain-containing protein [Bacteroidales bacterium]
MKRHILPILATLSVLALASSCVSPEIRTANALAKRVLGPKAEAVSFELISDTLDVFELETVDGKVVIRGNSSNSMATGLNHYLQNYCLANVSWYVYNGVELPEVMPTVPQKVRVEAALPVRFFLNYCTFGYTMPFWKWDKWERFIDWMALNGVNMPLAITGQEAVWQKVWRKYGLTDEQIREFFVGPAHLPWQRMCNLDRWQGPLPQDWIDGQKKLGRRILRRERALGMTPVLPAFAGHVPQELEQTQKGCETYRVSYWGGFADEYRCTFLSPMDPLFAQIQKDYLKIQKRLYGTDHIYGVDPFNEVDAPFWDPETLAKISKGIYDSMTAVDEDALWLQMGWLFYADPAHWTDENIEAYLTAVPQGRMMILDYYCDATQIWQRTKSFYGQPFIWCLLGNFGGMTGIDGDYYRNSEHIADAFNNAGPGFVGIGSTLEGFGVNEPIYEFILSKAWNTGISDYDYITNVADRHLGRPDENFRAASHYMADHVRVTHIDNGSSTHINAHPSLERTWHWTADVKKGYDIAALDSALALVNKVQGTSNYFEYDKANLTRQSIANRSTALRDAFTAAYRRGDREAMDRTARAFLDNCDSLTAVLSTRREFSLEDWIADARAWGYTPFEKDYYEMNARTLISVWGDSFHLWDYANRDFDGLVDTYYKVRWQMFFDAVRDAFDQGIPFENSHSTGYVGVSAAGTDPSVKGAAVQLDLDLWDFACDWAMIPRTEKSVSATSPDGSLTAELFTRAGKVYYSISKDGESIITRSPLGFTLSDGRILGEGGWSIESYERTSADTRWETVWGQSRWVRDNHRGFIATLTDGSDSFGVEFRLFNDGLGFRFLFPESLGDFEIIDETTEFNFAQPHTAWWMDADEVFYEAYGEHTPLDEITTAYTPVTITGSDGRFYSIHEAALLDFAKTKLQGKTATKLKVTLTPLSDGTAVHVGATRHSPWRTLLVCDKAGDLIESNVMLNLNEPCKIEDPSWCKPAKYVGIWWLMHKYLYTWYYDPATPETHAATTERTKQYIDFAAAHNIQGVLVEGWNKGWNGQWLQNTDSISFTEPYPDYDFDGIMQYARDKGVQMIIHNETGSNNENYFAQIDDAYAMYQAAGMHYVKTGNCGRLMDGKELHDSQYGVNSLHHIVEVAAQYQINIDEHEPCIPTGLCRTWPNLMTGEAIRGQEHDAWETDGGNRPEHQTVVPFIRGLAGPMDYTFGTFDFSNPMTPYSRVRTTIAKQLAQYVVIYSPLQMANDDPAAYEGVKAFDFISDVPTDWAKTKVLDAVIGDYVVTARRDRNSLDWYLGAITDENARSLDVPLDFLLPGKYLAQIYSDAPDASYEDNPTAVDYTERIVRRGDVLHLELATSGGTAIRFIRK